MTHSLLLSKHPIKRPVLSYVITFLLKYTAILKKDIFALFLLFAVAFSAMANNETMCDQVNAGEDVTICRGESVQMEATNGVNYIWSPTDGLSCTTCPNPIASPTTTTEYTVTCDDGSQDNFTDMVLVTVIPTAEIDNIATTDPSACNDGSRAITISATGGNSSLEYSIDNGANWAISNVFLDLIGGIYQVKVRNSDGSCEVDGGDLSLSFSSPSIDGITPNDPTDCDTDNGSLIIFASGGSTPNLEYSIDNGTTWQTSSTFTGLGPGTYQIMVRNEDDSCEVSGGSITLEAPAAPSIDEINITPTSDCGTSDGQITITVSSGSAPFQYSITGGTSWENANVFTDLTPGDYNIAVRNGDMSCEVSGGIVSMVEPAAPSIDNIEPQDPTDCGTSDGILTITASGGVGSLEYSSDNGSSWQSSNIFTGLEGGSYMLRVRNMDGTCESDAVATSLNTPVVPSIDAVLETQPQNCENPNGSIAITSNNDTGNFEYSIDNGTTWQNSNTFNNLSGGDYNIAVRDGGCVSNHSSVISLIAPPLATINGVASSSPDECLINNGSISIFASGSNSLEYSIDGGNTWQESSFFGNLSGGTYDIAVRNNNGFCQVNGGTETLTQLNFPLINEVQLTAPDDCGISNGVITILATGDTDLEYSITAGLDWSDTNTFSSLSGGTYDVRVRYTDGSCETSENMLGLEEPQEPVISGVQSTNNADCGGSNASITIEATGGSGSYEFSINGGSTWQTSGTFTGLSTNDYAIMVRNASGNCAISGGVVNITEPNAPSIDNIIAANPSGCGLSDGSLTIVASGDEALEYSIDNGTNWQSSNSFDNLSESSYPIAMRYLNGNCEVNGDNQTLIAPEAADFNQVFMDKPDCGSDNGRIEVSASHSGTAPLEYSADGGMTFQASNVFENLAEGNYELVVAIAGNGCQTSGGTSFLEEYAPPEITLVQVNNASDCGQSDGSIELTVSGSNTDGFDYTIDGGNTFQTSSSFPNLPTGTYMPGVRPNTTEATCLIMDTPIMLLEPNQPTIEDVSVVHPDCDGMDGSISITATGGSGVYEYSIDGGNTWQSDNTFNNLPEGNYQVAVRNADGSCPVFFDSITQLIEPDRPNVIMVNSTNPTCDSDDGSIEIIASGGVGNLEYSIDGGVTWQTDNIFNNLSIGNYEVLVRNGDGSCATMAASVQLTEPQAPEMTEINLTHPSDCDLSDGTIQIVASGIGTLEYSIDDGANWQLSPVFNGLEEGTYSIRVRFTDGSCELFGGTVTLMEPDPPTIDDVQIADPSDCGLTDGNITILASGGQGMFEYSINNGDSWQTSNVFNGLAPGAYQVLVRNADGSCPVGSGEFTIKALEMPTIIEVNHADPDCSMSNGSIIIEAMSSGNSLEYSIDGGLTWQSSNSFTGLAEDIYQIRVRNPDETCEVAGENVPLNEPAAPNLLDFDATQPDCDINNGRIVVTANGGITPLEYSIDGGDTWQESNIFENLGPDTYDIFVRNTDGSCPTFGGTTELIVNDPPQAISVAPSNSTDCNSPNGSITITTNDVNVEYSIDGGTTWQLGFTFSNLGGGTYSVIARNLGEDCTVLLATIMIEEPETPAISGVNITHPSDCGAADGMIEIIPAAGSDNLEYSIDGGNTWQASNNFTALIADNYAIYTRNDDGSCPTAQTPIELRNPNQPQIDAVNVSNSLCLPNTGSIQIIASDGESGLEYSIDGGMTWQFSNIFTNLSAGIYTPAVRNDDGSCEVEGTPVNIIKIIAPQITDVDITQPSDCGISDGSIVITASGDGDIEYSIDDGTTWQLSNTFNDLLGGVYQIVIRNADDGSCEVEFDENINLIGGEEPVINDVVLTEPSDCGLSDASIQILASGSSDLEYSIEGGLSWQTENTFTGLGEGIYEIRVRNIDGSCVVSAPNIVIIDRMPPDIDDIVVTEISSCGIADGSISIEADCNPPDLNCELEYSIDGGSTWHLDPLFIGLALGEYEIRVRYVNSNCEVDGGAVSVGGDSQPVITEIRTFVPSACGAADGRILIFLNIDGEFEYSIDGGDTWQDSHIFNDLLAGTYFIRIRYDDGNCVVEGDDTTLEGDNILISNVNASHPDGCDVENGTITITASGATDLEYSIDGGNTWQASNTFTGLGAGSYTIAVRQDDGTCETEGETITLSETGAPTISNIDFNHPSTCASSDGSIEITASGDADIEYSIDGGMTWQDSNTFENLSNGQYAIQIRYTNETCLIVGDMLILQGDDGAPSISDVATTDPSDCNSNDGAIIITANGTTDLEYSIDGGNTWQASNRFENLAGGSYTIAVRYTNETCITIAEETAVLTAPNPPIISDVNVNHPSACGENDGSISIMADCPSSNSNCELEYSIDDGATWQTENTFSNLEAAVYPILVRYAGGACETPGMPVTLNQGAAPPITEVTTTQAGDCGEAIASISISVAGGADNIEYSIDNGENWEISGNFNNITTGSYTILIRIAGTNCITAYDNNPVEVQGGSAVVITEVVSETPDDCDGTNARINITADCQPPILDCELEYSIDGGTTWQSSNIFDGLDEGDYEVQARKTDESCTTTFGDVSVILPASPIIEDVTFVEPSDCGATDGSITITADCPASVDDCPLEYSIDGGVNWQSSNVFDNLPEGIYDIQVRNQDGTCAVSFDEAIIMESCCFIRFTLEALEDGVYQVSMIPDTTLMNPMSMDLRITLIVPNQGFDLSNFMGVIPAVGFSVNNINGPEENPNFNYINISVPMPTMMINYEEGVSTPLFTFENSSAGMACTDNGAMISLMNNLTDPFQSPEVGNMLSISGIDEEDIIICTEGMDMIELNSILEDVEVTHPSDCNSSDGSISIITDCEANSDCELEYSIDGGMTFSESSIFDNLPVGNYEIIVRNIDAGCDISFGEVPLVLGAGNEPEIVTINTTNTSNCDSSDGAIEIIANGDNLEYSIDNGMTWQTATVFDNLSVAAYRVAVRFEDESCTVFYVNNPVQLQTNEGSSLEITDINTIDPSCANDDGLINVVAEGCGDLEYNIDDGSWQSSSTFEGLSSGTYSLNIRSLLDTLLMDSETVMLSLPSLCNDTITIIIPPDTTDICLEEVIELPNAPGEVIVCEEGNNIEVVVADEEVCVTLIPDEDVTMDTICLVHCDEIDASVCDTTVIIVVVEDINVVTDTVEVSIPPNMTTEVCITEFIDTPNGISDVSICESPDDIDINLNVTDEEVCLELEPIDGFLGTNMACVLVCDPFIADLCDTTIIVINVEEESDLPPLPDTIRITTHLETPIEVCVDEYQLPSNDVELTICGEPTDGMVAIDASCITYSPDDDFLGMDTVCVSVCEVGNPMNCDTAIVIITVEDIMLTTDTIEVTIIENMDSLICFDEVIDLPNDNGEATICEEAENVDAELNVTDNQACVTLTPDMNFTGSDILCVVICDENVLSLCDTTYILIEVEEDTPDLPPLPDTIRVTTDLETPIEVCVDEYELPSNDVELTICGEPTDGMVAIDASCITYSPDDDFLGMDTVCVSVCEVDNPMNCDTAIVIITVEDIMLTTDTIEVTIIENMDSLICFDEVIDLPNDNGEATICEEAENVDAELNVTDNQACVTLTPDMNFTGSDILCVVICDENVLSLCDTTYILIEVEEDTPDLPPLPDTIRVTTDLETPIEVCVDEYELPSDDVELTICGEPTDGMVAIDASCITYSPDDDFLGMDTVCVSVCEVGNPMNCDTTIVIITVEDIMLTTDTIEVSIPSEIETEVCFDEVIDLPNDNGQAFICNEADSITTTLNITNNAACVLLLSDMGFVGDDTLCVIVCDENVLSLCDTTYIIIHVEEIDPPCPEDIFEMDTLFSGDLEIDICIPVSASTYTVFLDGMEYDQAFESCASDTIVSYSYASLPGQGNAGPYNVDSWLVNDTSYAGLVTDIVGLISFMNFWDPSGDWTADTAGLRLIGGDLNNTYDSLVIRQDGADTSFVLLPVIAPGEDGIIITISGAGTHTVLVQNNDTDCADELIVVLGSEEGDTLNLVTDFETPIEHCLDTTALESNVDSLFLCESPENGSVNTDTLDIHCFVYTPDDGFFGMDTFCLVLCDDMDICDTTIVVVTVNPQDCELFPAELTIELEHCDSLASLCFEVNNFNDYQITDNGMPYTGNLENCAFDTMIRYTYLTVPDVGTMGPYMVDSWTVNGTMISGTFNDIPSLIDSMNVWDPMGNWVIDELASAIIGGNSANTYGQMLITQTDTGANATLTPNVETIPGGTAIALDTGFHEIILTDTVGGCVESISVMVNCPIDTMLGEGLSDTIIMLSLNQGQEDTICVDTIFGIPVEDIISIENTCTDQNTGNVIFELDTINKCVVMNPIMLGMDTACIEVCIAADSCATVTIIVEVLPPCEDFIPQEFIGTGVDCDSGDTLLCIPVPLGQMQNYSIEIDGETYTGPRLGCDQDSIFTYSYTAIIGLGSGPFSVDSWMVNNTTFSGEFSTIEELVDSLNTWDPTSNWIADESTLTISGADPNNIYGPLVIREINSGSMVTLGLNSTMIPRGTAIEVGLGTHQIVFTHLETGCRDTIMGTVSCTSTEVFMDTIMVGDMAQLCLDTLDLVGNFVSISNACEENSGELVLFEIREDTLCVTYEGIEPGTESACIIVCDDLGVCDTTYMIITVITTTGEDLVAVDDESSTPQGGTVVINILGNDIIPGNTLDTFFILDPPFAGTATFNTDGSVTYVHDGEECDITDVFSYVICNAIECDTADVDVLIECDTTTSGDFMIYQGFSPNGDDVNETFTITGLEQFPNNSLMIYNRWGNLVYEVDGYRNDWNGTWNGKDLPDGTYFYVFDDGEGTAHTGYLQIHR